MVPVVEDVALRLGRRVHRFPQVAHERCLDCGERVFGIEASQMFDRVLLRRKRRRAAA